MSNAETQSPSPRFGIAEWYGHSFVHLTNIERAKFATYRADKSSRLTKTERQRLERLEAKASGGILSQTEEARLEELRAKQDLEIETNLYCPFKSTASSRALCTKPGGVCSLRLYEKGTDNVVTPLSGERDGLRALCPNRFHEAGIAFAWVGKHSIDAEAPLMAGEVGFLESSGSLDGVGGDDVGRLDMILVDPQSVGGSALRWVATEIQAVYFSGPEMASDFDAIREDVAHGGSGLIWPTAIRRPDYRSSGPKRLMPQLQIKVPTLRRWGKKMAVVVDDAFFRSLGAMSRVEHLSNADIAWFVVSFNWSEVRRAYVLTPGSVALTTLEESVIGLTAGRPVSQPMFEDRIREKL